MILYFLKETYNVIIDALLGSAQARSLACVLKIHRWSDQICNLSIYLNNMEFKPEMEVEILFAALTHLLFMIRES